MVHILGMNRTLQPEILDSLSPTDPAAVHNRRDLRLTNAVMGNHRWITRCARRAIVQGERVLELGAGGGELGLRLHHAGVPVDGLDLWPRPAAWPANRAWHRSDLRTFSLWSKYEVLVGNLIFHQFSDDDLHRLGARIRHLRLIIACEPARRRASQLAYRFFAPMFGANHVTLHDAHVSIAAGFRGGELPALLGLSPTSWQVELRLTFLGAYRMVATRIQP